MGRGVGEGVEPDGLSLTNDSVRTLGITRGRKAVSESNPYISIIYLE